MVFPNAFSDGPDGFYPVSNACGQNGVSYATSPPNSCADLRDDNYYSCDVDPTMAINATSGSRWEGDKPPPLQCFPRTAGQTHTGHYDPMILNEDREGYMVIEEGNILPSRLGSTDVEGSVPLLL